MLKYVLKRIALVFVVFFIIATISFVLIKLLPLPSIKAQGRDANLVEMKREQMGYNKPIMTQYVIYWKNIFNFKEADGSFGWNPDFGLGEQMYISQSVFDVILEKIPYTIVVNLYSFLLAVPIGLLLGIYAALRKNRWQDHVVSTLVMLVVSVPNYVYAFLIQYFLCFRLNWFPLTVASRETADFFSWAMFKSMCPAILALGFGTVATLCRFTRAELSEVLTGDYLLLARTKGLTKNQAITRHAMRNAMVPILPMILGGFVDILVGSLVIEGIFSIPGIGSLFFTSISLRDYNFFMALSFFYTLIGLFANLVTDLSYGFIDPRIKMGAK